MTVRIVCDGCGEHLSDKDIALTVERTNGMSGGGMPNDTGHLCDKCGPAFWHAVTHRVPSAKATS